LLQTDNIIDIERILRDAQVIVEKRRKVLEAHERD